MTSPTQTVWCVGDAMVDCDVRGPFRRTQEDPTVTVLPFPDLLTADCAAGGAANVAVNLAAQGLQARLLAPIGSDPAGSRLAGRSGLLGPVLRDCGVVGSGTTVKVRYYADGRLVGRCDADHDSQPVYPPDDGTYPDMPQAVIVTDYGRGAVTADSARAWADWCYNHRVCLYADPKMGRQSIWGSVPVDVMVANWDEASGAACIVSPTGDPEQDRGAEALIRRLMGPTGWGPFGALVVKRGRHGSTLAETDDDRPVNIAHIPAVHAQAVYSLQGAGDSYLAALVAGRCRGLPLVDACLYASAAAGVAVSRPGTSVVSAAETVEAVRPLVAEPMGVLTASMAYHTAARLTAFGFTVGYTAGCFDLTYPHPGQLSTIRAAAAACDFLFVGVDSDARVRELKGLDRPNTPASDRVQAAAALRGVGAAFVFDAHPEAVVGKLRPAVMVKGGDYAAKGVPEAGQLKSWGGELIIAPTLHTPSTTSRLAH